LAINVIKLPRLLEVPQAILQQLTHLVLDYGKKYDEPRKYDLPIYRGPGEV